MSAGSLKLTRAEMIELVKKIMRAEGCKREIAADVSLFDASCLNPKKNELIFYPNGHPHNSTIPEPTADEIVELALTPGTVIFFGAVSS